MTTNNLISTPNIEGNVGSCTSQSIKVETGYNFLKRDYQTIVTNSCTGEVSTYNTWDLAGFPWAVVILGILIFWLALGIKADSNY